MNDEVAEMRSSRPRFHKKMLAFTINDRITLSLDFDMCVALGRFIAENSRNTTNTAIHRLGHELVALEGDSDD